jgi:acetolactate synthase-1/2/3 large subunit
VKEVADMPKVDGGELVVEFLKAQGVRRIFTVSGGGILPIYDACRDQGIELVHTRGELGASFMAEAWARTTREPGVCLVTQGPGTTYVLSALHTAMNAASPMIVIAGRAPVSQWERGAVQEMDPIPVVRSVTKWARTVPDAGRIGEYLSIAYRHALSGRPGPVFLDIPADVLRDQVERETMWMPSGFRAESRPQGDPNAVERAAKLIAEARRPVVITGGGIWWSDAGEELRRLVDLAHLPLFQDRLGRGAVEANHPLNFGLAVLSLNDVLCRALEECDLLLLAGGRLDFNVGMGQPPFINPDARMIQVDIEAEELGRNRELDVGIVGDAHSVLTQLADVLEGHIDAMRVADWLALLQEEQQRREEALAPDLNSSDVPIHPLRLCREVRDFMGPDGILTTGGGDIEFWGRMIFEPSRPGHYLRAGQTGCLGAATPYAISAKMAHPDKRVAALIGDGEFGYSAMEMETAVRYGSPIVCVIAMDCAWGMIRWQQVLGYGESRAHACDLEVRAYEKVVEALGGYGELVTEPGEIRPALERAFASGKPACLNVVTQSVVSPDTSWPWRIPERYKKG